MARKSASRKATSKPQTQQHLAEMIAGIQFAMLTTVGAGGKMHSRPMATVDHDPDEFDGSLWFFTQKDSPKVADVKRNPRVNLAYADADSNRYVSVSGRAKVVTDRNQIHKRWSPMLKAWFPKGKTDPNIALLEIKADDAEYWDAPASAMVRAAYYLKAIVTGKKAYDVADNKKVSVKPPKRAKKTAKKASKKTTKR